MSLPDDSPPAEAPVRTSVSSIVLHPFRTLWNQDATFHARLGSFLTISGVLLAVASLVVAIVLGAPSSTPPVEAESTEAVATTVTESVSCADNADEENPDIFLPCIEGRYRSEGFTPTVEVPPSSAFEILLYFKNTSDEAQRDVVLNLELPDDFRYIEGSTWLANSNGVREVSDRLTAGGMNIGHYGPLANAYLKVAVFTGHSDTYDCGTSIEVIKLTTTTDLGVRVAELPVEIQRDC